MQNNKKYTYQNFLEIIKTLRGENGCPWDRVQTHESLKPCMMEEAAELLASIRIYDQTGNPENMREELGDVLLQVVMHAQIAAEEGHFTMEDVVDEVSRKMIRRHPHVFGTSSAEGAEEALINWEEIKKEEKKDKEWIPYSRELEKIIADILIRLSDIARIARISQEQVLTDRIEDLIDRYEKNPANTSGDRKMP